MPKFASKFVKDIRQNDLYGGGSRRFPPLLRLLLPLLVSIIAGWFWSAVVSTVNNRAPNEWPTNEIEWDLMNEIQKLLDQLSGKRIMQIYSFVEVNSGNQN